MYARLAMQGPSDERHNRRPGRPCRRCPGLLPALLLTLLAGTALAASKPDKQRSDKQGTLWLQLRLDDLGFPGISAPFLDSGASMFTVHFLDDAHLLLTYSERSLVRRLPNDPDEGKDDRIVAAKVIELPSARVLAQTEWRMHDHARYLWPLGGGSFLLRIGDELSTISPLAKLQANAAGGHPQVFERTAIAARPMRPSAVVVSPDGGLITVETVVRTATSTGQTVVVLGDTDTPVAEQQGSKTLIDFYRVDHTGPVPWVEPAGVIAAGLPLLLPLDADGLLWAHQEASDTWSLTFDPFGGKTLQLGTLQSSCLPRLQMLDRSEFLALGCRGADDRLKLASFGLDGKETWEEPVGDFGVPTFAFAPAAARFAVSHIIPAQVPVTAGQLGTPASQEVRVYQNASGDLLLQVECSPIMKSAENFDLSPDGTLAVVVRKNALAIYKLPPVSARDRQDIADVMKFAPPAVTSGPVTLPRLTTPVAAAATAQTAEAVAASAAAPVPISPAPLPAAPQQTSSAQAQQPSAPRKPPTLLEPGEKPEFGTPNTQPPQ
jgi:hypothetical protein